MRSAVLWLTAVGLGCESVVSTAVLVVGTGLLAVAAAWDSDPGAVADLWTGPCHDTQEYNLTIHG